MSERPDAATWLNLHRPVIERSPEWEPYINELEQEFRALESRLTAREEEPNAVEAILQVIPVVLLEVSKELRDAWLDGREPTVTEESFRARVVELIRSGGVEVPDVVKLLRDGKAAEERAGKAEAALAAREEELRVLREALLAIDLEIKEGRDGAPASVLFIEQIVDVALAPSPEAAKEEK